ncbi:MAG: hypothetical protein JKY15_00535 [Deltaproteobacteria bacterium]|nr:hypothetical protein [Deltaproteobacteria bacterium]
MGEKLEAAHQESQKILEQARVEAAQLVEEAKQEGLTKGHQKAEQYKAKLTKLKELYASESEHDLIRYSIEVAEKLVSAELKTSPEAFLRFVQEALKTVSDAETIRIRAKPSEIPIIKQNKEKLINLMERAEDIDIREDKQVGEGILLQTESGVIDAQLSTQIEEITRVLGI